MYNDYNGRYACTPESDRDVCTVNYGQTAARDSLFLSGSSRFGSRLNRQEKEWSKTEPVEVRGGYESATGIASSEAVTQGGGGSRQSPGRAPLRPAGCIRL